MAISKKEYPKGVKAVAGSKENYKSSTVKGKGNTKKQDVKAVDKKLGGSSMGKSAKPKHADVKADKKLVKSMVKKSCHK